MMTNDLMLGGVYLLMAVMLLVGSLMVRREPAARLVTMALAWIAIFAGGFVLFTFRDNLGWVAQRLKAEAVGTPVQQGQETRIPMAIDGHFWVEAFGSARDLVELFGRLGRGQLVSPALDRRMVGYLLNQQVNDRLPLLLPAGTPIGHKTGEVDSLTHDAGLVHLKGHPNLRPQMSLCPLWLAVA